MAAKLILIRGLPGSGKSTLAKKLFKRGWRHYEADQFHMQGGVYMYEASRAGKPMPGACGRLPRLLKRVVQ
jgi:adenylate kinase family enzyme